MYNKITQSVLDTQNNTSYHSHIVHTCDIGPEGIPQGLQLVLELNNIF